MIAGTKVHRRIPQILECEHSFVLIQPKPGMKAEERSRLQAANNPPHMTCVGGYLTALLLPENGDYVVAIFGEFIGVFVK
jgi:hypothetical protein